MDEKRRWGTHLARVVHVQAIATICLFTLPAVAGEPSPCLRGRCVPDCIGQWYQDDYCPKKQPCAGVRLRSGCDDYCGKRLPCVGAPLRFGCDDYCKKCPPDVCSGPPYQSGTCGPTSQPCDAAICDTVPGFVAMSELIEMSGQPPEDDDSEQVDQRLSATPEQVPTVIVQLPEFKLTRQCADFAAGGRKVFQSFGG